MQAYPKINPTSTPIRNAVESAFGNVFLLEREAREFGNPELMRIAEKVKDADVRLLHGEPVPRETLRELIGFVRHNTEPVVVEVGTGG